jgi:hypothetical protein
MWKEVAEKTAMSFVMSRKPEQFPVIDGESYMIISPKELVEYSYNLLSAYVITSGIMDTATQKGTSNASHDHR